MTQGLTYTTRREWAAGFAMSSHSARVHDWLGGREHWLVTPDKARVNDRADTDGEAATSVSPPSTRRGVVDYSDMMQVLAHGRHLPDPVVFIHPSRDDEAEVIRELVERDIVRDAFVLVWADGDVVRLWLEARSARNLLSERPATRPDALMLKAAGAIVDEEYNGLASGRGKDVTIQAVRALAAEGYPLSRDQWMRAVLAAGGTARSAQAVGRYVTEIAAGRKHRVKPAFVPDVVSVWREMLVEEGNSAT